MKVKHINICKDIFDFKHMGFFLICKGMWGLRDQTILFSERGVIPYQHPGNVLLASFFVGINFHTKNPNRTLNISDCNR